MVLLWIKNYSFQKQFNSKLKYDYNTSAGQYNKEYEGYTISMNVNINIFSKENKLIPWDSL